MQIQPVKVSKTEDGVRLNRWFMRHFPRITNAEFHKLCRTGQIRINSRRCRGNEILYADDLIRIPALATNISDLRTAEPKRESGDRFSLSDLEILRRCIIHDDADIVAFNKPSGLAVQGGSGISKSLDKMAQALFPHDTILPVHRLDRETSGVILLAKNQRAAQILSEEFQSKIVTKEYLALLSGGVKPKSGILDTFMVKGKVLTDGEAGAYEKTTGTKARRAITKYQVLDELPGVLSWVKFIPATGRTHQLRLHAAFSLNAPIVGDSLYQGYQEGWTNKMDPALESLLVTKNLFLFAHKLSFKHPTSGRIITINAQLPDFMQSVVKFLEFKVE